MRCSGLRSRPLRSMRRSAACCAAIVLACAAGFASAARTLPIEGPFGSGAGAVWLLRPAGPVRSIVVFGHGYKHGPPTASQPWVQQFSPWLAHLLSTGNAVVFPRYQLGGDEPGRAFVTAYLTGLRLAFARL